MRQPEAFLDPQNAPKSLAPPSSPRPHWGSLQPSPRPPSWIQGVVLLRLLLLRKGRGGDGRAGEGKGGQGRGREGRGGEGMAGEGRVFLVLKLPLAKPLL